MKDIAHKTKTAVLWRFAGGGVGSVIELGTKIILARLLMPEDFGIVALALIVIGLVRNLSVFGLGQALVQRDEINHRHLTAAFWGSAALGALLAGAVYLIAGPAARFFGEPAVKPVIQLLSIAMILSSLYVVPSAMLQRELAFRELFWANLAMALTYGAVGIPLALMGFNFWSLAWASLSREVIALFAFLVITRYLPSLRFRLSGLMDLMRFGVGNTAAGILGYVGSNVDYFVVGRWLDPSALGLYKKAYDITALAPRKLSESLYVILFASFSRLQSDTSRVKYAYARALTGIGVVTFPLIAGMAITAPLFIPIVLGPQWRQAVIPTQIMCIAAAFMVLSYPAAALIRGMGHVYAEFWREFLYLLIVSSGCLVGVRWGINAVAVVVVIGYGALATTKAQYTYKLIGFGLTDYFRVLRVPLLGCAVLLASAAGTLNLSATGMTDSAVLLVTIATSGLAYCLAVWLLPWNDGRDIMRDLVQLVRRKHRVVDDKIAISTEVGTDE